MSDFLLNCFLRRGEDISDPRVRARIGTAVSIIAIAVNLLLFAAKFAVGKYLAFSVAIYADAMNNLADAGTSIISLVSFRIAAKPADRDHPFGHARMEYVTSMIVAFLVLHTSIDLITESGSKLIFGGEATEFSIWSVVVLGGAIVLKLLLCLLNRALGKKINSPIMIANAADSLSDCTSTAAVLGATVLVFFFPALHAADAVIGILVAVLIFVSGIKIFLATKDQILGEAPPADTVDAIRKVVAKYPGALGVHDMFVHSYGSGACMVSFHVEVDGSADIFETHDMVDNIEKEIRDSLGHICSIHMDPIVTDDVRTKEMRELAVAAAKSVDERLDIHDFRFVEGSTHTNLIFDIEAPFEVKLENSELSRLVCEKISEQNVNYFCVITIDRK